MSTAAGAPRSTFGDDLQRQAQRAGLDALGADDQRCGGGEPGEHAAQMLHRHGQQHGIGGGGQNVDQLHRIRQRGGRAGADFRGSRDGLRARGSRAHSVTLLPARAAWMASAVPQAPAPTTATLLIGQPPHRRALAGLAIAQAVEQRARIGGTSCSKR